MTSVVSGWLRRRRLDSSGSSESGGGCAVAAGANILEEEGEEEEEEGEEEEEIEDRAVAPSTAAEEERTVSPSMAEDEEFGVGFRRRPARMVSTEDEYEESTMPDPTAEIRFCREDETSTSPPVKPSRYSGFSGNPGRNQNPESAALPSGFTVTRRTRHTSIGDAVAFPLQLSGFSPNTGFSPGTGISSGTVVPSNVGNAGISPSAGISSGTATKSRSSSVKSHLQKAVRRMSGGSSSGTSPDTSKGPFFGNSPLHRSSIEKPSWGIRIAQQSQQSQLSRTRHLSISTGSPGSTHSSASYLARSLPGSQPPPPLPESPSPEPEPEVTGVHGVDGHAHRRAARPHRRLQKAESSPLPERYGSGSEARRASQPAEKTTFPHPRELPHSLPARYGVESAAAAAASGVGRRASQPAERTTTLREFPFSSVFTYAMGRATPFPCGSDGVMINSTLAHQAFLGEMRNANNYIQQSPTAPTATDNGSHKGHRQRSVSLSTPHRASDINVTPLEAATLYRTSRGLPVEDPFVAEVLPTLTGDEHQIFALFFQYHTCYDLIPKSAKLVIFDTKLLVKKAFFALVYNGVRAAPLWDHDAKRFVGMLTITDFIKILRMNYKPSSSSGTPSSSSSGSSLTQDGHAHISADTPTPEQEQVKAAAEAVVNSNLDLEEHKLETWRQALASDQVRDLISIEPEETLYEAIRFLIENKIHRLPIIDKSKGNVLYILTHKRLLRFLFLYIDNLPHPAYFEQSIHTLGIGTYDQIETARPDTRIIEALNKFMEKRISALPIVDEDNKLVDIYAKFDVINLAAEKTYDNLEMTLKDANRSRNEWFEGVHSCKKTDSLFNVMSQIVQAEVHRLVIVDEENRVEGVISLSDILAYVVLRPTEQQGVPEAPTAATVPETDNAPAVPTAGNTAAPETTEEQLAKDFSNKANV